MIEYVRETLDDRPIVSARSELRIGATTRTFTMPLGVWPADEPDPGGPLGLSSAPVVVLPHVGLETIAEAGARRAGRGPRVATVTSSPEPGLDLLAARRSGAAVIIATGSVEVLRLARVLGGRPLAVLPLDRSDEVAASVEGLDVDVEVAVPIGDDRRRRTVRAIVGPLELESMHHLVEVDPRPAYDELGLDLGGAGLGQLAAAAAGVLAGRLAARNERWRRDVGG
jgi:hypothetical protein